MTQSTADKVLQALAPYDLKNEGHGKYRANSPLRPGSNSHAFAVKIEDGEHGAYHDHVNGDGGSLYELAAHFGIETPKSERAAVEDSKRAYRDLADYAAAHGTTADVLKAAGWSDVAMVYDAHVDHRKDRPALSFKTTGGVRYRFVDGLVSHYKSQHGYKACWYGLKKAIQITEQTWKPLVICNGEVSTIVAHQHGIPAACVTAGEKRLPENCLQEFKAVYKGAVIIALDCDDTGRKAAAEIKAQLVGYDVAVVDLGLSTGGDLADFCKLHTDTALVSLLELVDKAPSTPNNVDNGDPLTPLVSAMKELKDAIRKDENARKQEDIETLTAQVQAQLDRVTMASSTVKVLSFDELTETNLRLLDYALSNPDPIRGLRSNIPSLDKSIGGFAPEIYVIYGATSMGKSTLAVSLAREFIKQGAGLIVPTESPAHRWQTKLVASICKISSDKIETGQLTPEEIIRVRRAYEMLRDHKCRMVEAGSPTPAQIRAATLREIEANDYKWIIVDSASKMGFPGTTSIYDRTTGISNGLQDLYRETGLPIIVTSQVGRDVSERGAGKKLPTLDDAYGGGVIEHNAGVVLGLYNHQYYVDRGLEEPSPEFPADTSLVRVLKNRWRGGAGVNAVMLQFVGGAGFYERATVHFDDLTK